MDDVCCCCFRLLESYSNGAAIRTADTAPLLQNDAEKSLQLGIEIRRHRMPRFQVVNLHTGDCAREQERGLGRSSETADGLVAPIVKGLVFRVDGVGGLI